MKIALANEGFCVLPPCRRSGVSRRWLAMLFVALLLGCVAAATASTEVLAPPARADIAPLIGRFYPNDQNGDRIDDGLASRAAAARAKLTSPASAEQTQAATTTLQSPVDVQLIFDEPVTQQQIDDFLSHGGQITYLYKAVSYGWNGRIALGEVETIPALMGSAMVLVEEAKPAVLHMDIATRNGRVRPIWASGFADNPGGFSGSSSITIAAVDTGIDPCHTDLAGRQVYWHDFTTDSLPAPSDYIQHGSHVMGIALGTGISGGSGTGTLYYTDTGDLTSVTSGSFYPSPIALGTAGVTYNSVAQWTGGGSTSLYHIYHTNGASGGWTTISSASAGYSPLTENNTFTASTSRGYSVALLSNGGTVKSYVVANSVTNYPGIGDGFNKLQGVAPACNWASAKVFRNSDGSGLSTWIGAAIDDLVANRIANNVKVMNLSLGINGNPGLSSSTRQKVNTAVNNGIVVVVSAGNDGRNASAAQREIDDPGRAAMALTLAAANDIGQLTDYTSQGFSSPGSTSGQEEDYKPDIMAPGGSSYYSLILSVDSGSADGPFADQQPNDYYNISGTSMASPFAAGCAALVIDAMQQTGVSWDFSSSQHSRYVKMVLCATASETNANREGTMGTNPTLQRAGTGPSGFPAGKDLYEGYGLINPDAAVEAVTLSYAPGSTATETLGSGPYDRRVWARKVSLAGGSPFQPSLTVPAGGDFDLYLYSDTPAPYGTPVILASSTNAGTGASESLSYTPSSGISTLLVVKRVSGSGSFSLTSLAPQTTLTTSTTDGGTVTAPGIGTFSYNYGTAASIVATPNANYHFVNWTGTGVTAGKVADPNAANTTITMDGDYTTVANFAINLYAITAAAQTNGSLIPSGIVMKEYGGSQLFTATPHIGYTVDTWYLDGNSVQTGGTIYTLENITAAHSVAVSFKILTYTVSASAGANGSIDPNGNVVKDHGSSQLFTATPDIGYTVDTWSVDGNSVQTGGTIYTLENITAAHSVAVSFKILTYTVSASAGANGSIDPNGNVVKDHGSSQLFTATPDIGYTVDTWSVDGNSVQIGGIAYTLENITAAHSVAVSFKILTYTISASAGANGSIDPNGNVVKGYGSSQLFTAMPDIGYTVDTWSVDGNSVQIGGIAYTLTDITSTHTVQVSFKVLRYTITGHIRELDGVTPLRDVMADANNGGGVSGISDVNGYYRVSVPYGWSGIVTPLKEGFTFEPNSISYNNIVVDDANDYVATLKTYAIRGHIIAASADANIVDVNVAAANGGGPWTSRYGGGSALSDPNGYYSVKVDYKWSGKVTPSKYAHSFEPNSIAYLEVLADQNDQDFAATLLTFAISGYIRNSCGNPIVDVNVVANNGGNSTKTDPNGYYKVWVSYDWSGSVTPSRPYYTFTPPQISYVSVLADVAGQDYIGSNPYDLDCSGNIDYGDLGIFAANWLARTESPHQNPCDFYTDPYNTVDFLDYALFTNAWLTQF